MTTINEQNSKQIRKPMEVYVRMDLSDKSITMTYSGYSSAKIADGKLDQTDWKMRKLTDLQGDGYPLDSSCTLYNPSTAASAGNGKIGVRGDIGQPVSVTITGSSVMDSATIIVTGASSVSHDGGTSAIVGSSVIVSIEDSSATLTFTPKSADQRVEISDIIPGIMFNVTNENMISCTLSLRADLSIVDPTLPESELNLDFYYDEDISETLAAIPEDTPITYRAGYDGNLSPVRKFYVSGQVTYKDNVVSVHAVDSVHFLGTLSNAIATVDTLYSASGEMADLSNLSNLSNLLYALLKVSIPWVDFFSTAPPVYTTEQSSLSRCVFEKGSEFRSILAQVMAYFHSEELVAFCESGYSSKPWPTFVDAGIPIFSATFDDYSYANRRRIKEEDCADIERTIDKSIGEVKLADKQLNQPPVSSTIGDYRYSHIQVGTAEWYRGDPIYVTLDDYTFFWNFGFESKEFKTDKSYANIEYVLPAASDGGYLAYSDGVYPDREAEPRENNGTVLMSPDAEQRIFRRTGTGLEDVFATGYNQVIPRNPYYDPESNWYLDDIHGITAMWLRLRNLGMVGDGNSMSVPAYGGKLLTEDSTLTFSSGVPGDTVELDLDIKGRVLGTKSENGRIETIFPDLCMKSIFDKSPNKGSFLWKGDPRMQPRDVFTFVKLDGTEIDCTIEQIDLEHVGGGTTAKITYREGIV